MYDLAYIDNLAWTSNYVDSIEFAYHNSIAILGDYGFGLQQFHTNCSYFQDHIDRELVQETECECKLFGLIWSKDADCIRVKDVNLDMKANTKRSILASLNSVFDPFGVCLPISNRAHLFLHKLQLHEDLSWDCPLPTELQTE